jgi:isopenicillin N synthase-like dioxygenase
MSKSGEWISADPVPGCFVINIGDMINNWTNDLYKSTLHRVIHKGSNYRISVPFFFEPSFDAVIKPLEKCVKESGKAPIYEPIMYGDHLLSKVTNNFLITTPNSQIN